MVKKYGWSGKPGACDWVLRRGVQWGHWALNLPSLCQVQNCQVSELHCQVCRPFRLRWGETRLPTTGDAEHTLWSHTDPVLIYSLEG